MSPRRIIIWLLLLLVLPSGLLAAGAREVLQRAQLADKHVSYRGLKLAAFRFADGMITSTLKVVHLKPDKTRTDYFTPAELAGVVFIEDSTTSWKYYPREEIWEAYPRGAILSDASAIQSLEDYDMRMLGTEWVANRPTYVILTVRKGDGQTARRLWVDKEHFLIMRSQVESPRGVLNSSRFLSIDLNPGDISPSAFKISGKVRRAKQPDDIDFRPIKPTYLPRGYRIVGMTRMVVNRRACVHFQFSNGANIISLFQRAGECHGNGRESVKEAASTLPSRYVNAVSWTRGGLLLTLVGSVPRTELKKIALSIQ